MSSLASLFIHYRTMLVQWLMNLDVEDGVTIYANIYEG